MGINSPFLGVKHINSERNNCCARLNDTQTKMLLSHACHACRSDMVRTAVNEVLGTRDDSHQLAASAMGTMFAANGCDVGVAWEIVRW